jgi:hypothetical protein
MEYQIGLIVSFIHKLILKAFPQTISTYLIKLN